MTTTAAEGPSYGSLATLELANEYVRLRLVPELGGRVISLQDRATHREWLVQADGPPLSRDWALAGAVFGPAEAAGWDECLPTVASVADPLGDGTSMLRDHGDVWGRPTEAITGPDAIIVSASGVAWPYRITRELHLDGASVLASYTLSNNGPKALPFLWSLHALFDLEPGSTLWVDGLDEVRLMYVAGLDLGPTGQLVGWPRARLADGSELDLSVVPDNEARTAVKLQGVVPPTKRATGISEARIQSPDGSSLRITWDPDLAPAAAIWLDHGGWPADAGRRQVAIGPTTSPDDDLMSAIHAGRALTVEPGAVRSWEVRMTLGTAANVQDLAAGT